MHRWRLPSLQLQAPAAEVVAGKDEPAVVMAAREVGEGDFLSSPYRRDITDRRRWGARGRAKPERLQKEDIAARAWFQRAVGGGPPPAAVGPYAASSKA